MTGGVGEPVPVGRPLAVMAAWYAAALVLLACGFAPEWAEAAARPEPTCAEKTLGCSQVSTVDIVALLSVPVLVSCVVISWLILVVMMRWVGGAVALGTASAFGGWVTGALLVVLGLTFLGF